MATDFIAGYLKHFRLYYSASGCHTITFCSSVSKAGARQQWETTIKFFHLHYTKWLINGLFQVKFDTKGYYNFQ